MAVNNNNFFDGPFFDGPFFDAGIVTPDYVPGGGSSPSQGYSGYETKVRTKEEVRREREDLGILPKRIIEEVAQRQAERLETDKQKHFEELNRELELRGVEWDSRYLESLNEVRERLINAEISLRLRQKLMDEEALMLLTLIAASA